MPYRHLHTSLLQLRVLTIESDTLLLYGWAVGRVRNEHSRLRIHTSTLRVGDDACHKGQCRLSEEYDLVKYIGLCTLRLDPWTDTRWGVDFRGTPRMAGAV